MVTFRGMFNTKTKHLNVQFWRVIEPESSIQVIDKETVEWVGDSDLEIEVSPTRFLSTFARYKKQMKHLKKHCSACHRLSLAL